MEKDSKDQEESTSCPSELLRDLYARARGRLQTWEGLPVSALHLIQAGNDLFIGEDEAYIMNRMKKEKSMLSKEGHVCVLDLFVKVPSDAVAPIKYKPLGS